MQCFGLLVTLLHISSKTADDFVENNDQVILAGLKEETFCCTTKKWKFVDLKFTYKKTNLCRFFNWFYENLSHQLL